MVRHIVMIKMKEAKQVEKRQASLEIKTALDKLPEKIEEIEFYQTGLNISESPNAYDLVLISDFENLEKLDAYRVHAEHVAVLDIIKKYAADIKVTDFEY